MAKITPLGIRISPETREALRRAAEDDMRSMSTLTERILIDWLRERGYLPSQDEPKPSPTPEGGKRPVRRPKS